MFQIKRQLTNVRPKDSSATLTCAPTPGVIKLSPAVAELLDVQAGEFASIVEAEVEINGEAVTRSFLFKGKDKTETDGQVGAKLRNSTEVGAGGGLQFSSSNAWETLKGDVNSNVKYKVHGVDADDVKPIVDEGVTYLMLEYIETTPKTVKTKKTGENSVDMGGDIDGAAAIADD